jgi:hypothetical protein
LPVSDQHEPQNIEQGISNGEGEGGFAINLPHFIIHYSLFDIRYSNKNQLLAASYPPARRGFKP